MKTYTIQWTLISVIIGFLLYGVTSLITKTTFNNVFQEFEILVMLIGFTTLLSTIIICTKIIIDKISKLKESGRNNDE